MSFPNLIYGEYGDEKVTAASAIGGLYLGTKMVLPDGREFVHCKAAAASALVAGRVYDGSPGITCLDTLKGLAVLDGAIGATTVTVGPVAGTVVAASAFNEGYLFFSNSAGPGKGNTYKIKTTPSALSTGAGASFVVTLDSKDGLTEAITAASTKCGLRPNPYSGVTLTTANTIGTSVIIGVAPVDVTAGEYCWIQRKGPAACETDNTTLIIGVPVTASTTVTGEVAVMPATSASITSAKGYQKLGTCIAVAASAEYSLINLELP